MKELDDKTNESQMENIQRVSQESSNGGTAQLVDNRPSVAVQRKLQDSMGASSGNDSNPIQRKTNKTGLPDNLKSGIENLSGYSMDDVKVHYNSSKPAQLKAHAYAQGTDIHLGSGQEKHLAHEAWHVVQQKQGRVKPTRQLKSKVNINDDEGLEREADVMGARALRGQTMLKGVGMHSGLRSGNLEADSSVRQPKLKIAGNSNGEQPIQANGWARNIDTGKTRALKEGDGLDLDEEYLNERFLESGAGYEYGPNFQIDPDTVGGENGVIEIPEEHQRPDDVARNNPYRAAVHRLQDLYFFVIEKDRPRAGQIDTELKRFQDLAKVYAKEFKKDKRNLIKSDTNYAQKAYNKKMTALTSQIDAYFEADPDADKMTPEERQTSKEKWRGKWREILDVVERVLRAKWPRWRDELKENMRQHLGINKMVLRKENWRLKFGGSLGKGYKGPPKQNVRFVTTRFDVDANMDAPSLANYLLNVKNRRVDRGTIKVEDDDRETRVREMDAEMDEGVKDELIQKELADQDSVEHMVSEPFETLINAKENRLRGNAAAEGARSSREQKLRDDITKRNGEPGRAVIKRFLSKVKNSNVPGIAELLQWEGWHLLCFIPITTNHHLDTDVIITDEQINTLRELLNQSEYEVL